MRLNWALEVRLSRMEESLTHCSKKYWLEVPKVLDLEREVHLLASNVDSCTDNGCTPQTRLACEASIIFV